MIDSTQPGKYIPRPEPMPEQARRINDTAKQSADPWVHRSAGMRCQTCIWYVAKHPAAMAQNVIGGYQPAPAQIGRCRRHAPTMGGYPVVYMTDWCGDHRLDENKI